MINLDERLKKLEEAFGVNAESAEARQRVKEKSALIFYEETIHRSDGSWELAEKLIARYGSLQSALDAYKDIDEYNNLNNMTKAEKEEYERLKSQFGLLCKN